MNNSDFRSLLLSNSSHPSTKPTSASPPPPRTTSLGSRKSSFIPRNIRPSAKTSYNLKSTAASSDSTLERPAKKLKTLDLGKGYTNRALERLNNDSEDVRDEKERRIHALARKVVQGELEEEEFERLREEIAGGDVESTHLVRGLDRKLLERVRKGEDVMTGEGEEEKSDEPVDEDFEELEAKEVQTREKEKIEKKGELNSEATAATGAKRNRDAILAELKAKRAQEAQARLQARPDLGDKFRKIEERKEKPRTMIDSKGREVIITRDENGKIKKKVRKVAPPPDKLIEEANRSVKFLDEDVVMPKLKEASPAAPEEDTLDNMFDDVADDYDPLAGLVGDDSSSSNSSDSDAEDGEINEPKPPAASAPAQATTDRAPDPTHASTPPALPSPHPSQPRNYFSTTRPAPSTDETLTPAPTANPFQDPSFLSAISRAGNMAKFKMHLGDGDSTDPSAADASDKAKPDADDDNEEDADTRLERLEKEARLKKKRAELMASMGRDDEDLDLGFGGGRFDEDDDGEEGGKVKLSEWGKDGDGDEEGRGGGKGREKRKRTRNKGGRKGDKDGAKDVLEVMRRREGR
ncbi:hypothetical protein BDZ85DRAFT_315533 [Elsinoe ampelina]|uniref:RED-like N-terminal domain-containing protein n=1 Tax=Elsinoe ampelina TaxID=302913 RepID=A0A6A6GR30_9PEZI|nr:hypothetical protein BDZ85DRAFT_315533 [Elsinoe ampelina]